MSKTNQQSTYTNKYLHWNMEQGKTTIHKLLSSASVSEISEPTGSPYIVKLWFSLDPTSLCKWYHFSWRSLFFSHFLCQWSHKCSGRVTSCLSSCDKQTFCRDCISEAATVAAAGMRRKEDSSVSTSLNKTHITQSSTNETDLHECPKPH